jgi:hemerythrin
VALFEWKDSYSVGVARFDMEHKRLFVLLNELSDAMNAGQGRFVVGRTLNELFLYTRQHFAAEENAMAKTNFGARRVHELEHRELAERVERFQKQYASGETHITIDVLYFLRDWLEKHILETDRKYSAHLQKNPV